MGVSRMSHDLIRFVVKAFDLKNAGTTKVVPTSGATRLFVPVHVHVVIATKVGTQSTPFSVSLGNNSTDNNIVSSVFVATSSAVGSIVSGDSSIVAGGYDCSSSNGAGGGIIFKTAGGGGTLTSMTGDIHVIGYWVS